MDYNQEIELIRAELAETKFIKEYEYWSNLTAAEKAEVNVYRKSLVADLNTLSKIPAYAHEKADKSIQGVVRNTRPPRPPVFDRYV
ncbi:MAG: hypothetical protein ACRCXX_12000 [Cetobacterium sp.]|uniref:hypothetical protein n=1 Tax=Cetobacterium sp. TaxID=2071632 RepID=UPI003F3B4137